MVRNGDQRLWVCRVEGRLGACDPGSGARRPQRHPQPDHGLQHPGDHEAAVRVAAAGVRGQGRAGAAGTGPVRDGTERHVGAWTKRSEDPDGRHADTAMGVRGREPEQRDAGGARGGEGPVGCGRGRHGQWAADPDWTGTGADPHHQAQPRADVQQYDDGHGMDTETPVGAAALHTDGQRLRGLRCREDSGRDAG